MSSREEKIKKLQEAIVGARTRLGLPAKGKISIAQLTQALREDPPVEELTKFVKHQFLKDQAAQQKKNSSLFQRPGGAQPKDKK